jgi:aspartate racemase
MAVGVLGILKAGGAYVPLDAHYPAERLGFMLRDCGASMVLSQQDLVAALPAPNAEVVLLDKDWPEISRQSEANLQSVTRAEQLAYVIYTSGSSGQPKGVLVTHGGVVNHALAVAELFDLGPADRVAQCNSLSFDISVEELFSSWMSGASLVLCPAEKFLPDQEFSRWLAGEEITVVNLPTPFWQQWVYALERGARAVPECLRLVVVGGDKARPEVLKRWQSIAHSQSRWINTYGPTETTVTTTFYEGSRTESGGGATVPIGRPIAGAEVHVLDGKLQAVPVGVVGELYIGGAGLARGYLNCPELTGARFIAHPFKAGERLYRSGDLGRYLADGNIEFIGRTDQQVKVRGFRIELGEIESVLMEHRAVREAVVMAREEEGEDVGGGGAQERRLVAYVVGEPEAVAELRGFVKEKLPEYMVPSAFVLLERLPLTPTGKLDRKALPAPDRTQREIAENYTAPRNPTEELLVELWSKLLSAGKLGIHDNFFDLGGHSLLATQLVSRVREAFQVDFGVRVVFEAPTIAEMALRIDESMSDAAEVAELAAAFAEVESLADMEIEQQLQGEN